MTSEQDVAMQKLMEAEAETLATLLSGPDRCVMVHVIVAYNDDRDSIDHVHAVSGNTTVKHAHQFMKAIECKLHWLKDSILNYGRTAS